MKTSVLLCAAAIGAWACGSTDPLPVAEPATAGATCILRGDVVSPAAVTLHVGDQIQLSATAGCARDNPALTSTDFRWISSDTTIAIVDSSAVVRARTTGFITVTATEKARFDNSGAAVVTVTP